MIRIIRDVLDCGPGPAVVALAGIAIIIAGAITLAEYYSGRVR